MVGGDEADLGCRFLVLITPDIGHRAHFSTLSIKLNLIGGIFLLLLLSLSVSSIKMILESEQGIVSLDTVLFNLSDEVFLNCCLVVLLLKCVLLPLALTISFL